MELIGLKGTEKSLSTPALTKYITQELSTDGIGHNWVNRENTPCKTCTGTGVDREDTRAVLHVMVQEQISTFNTELKME